MKPEFYDDLSVIEGDFVVMPLLECKPIPKFTIPKGKYLFNLSKMSKRKTWEDEEIQDIFLLLKKPSLYKVMKRKVVSLWIKALSLFS